MSKKVILDVDPGIDDALAILLAYRSPELEILGITTVSGNVHVSKGAINALRTLEAIKAKDTPVYIGQDKPLLRKLETAEWVHGSDGLGDANIPMPSRKPNRGGVKFIIETIMNSKPNEITLIATGPLTNIAVAIILEPDLVKRVKELVIMGGAYGLTPYGTGNVTQVSEFNAYTDPEAAKIVFESGIPLTAVGLDVTIDPQAILTKDKYEQLASLSSDTARFATSILKNFMNRFGIFQLHDPMAVIMSIDKGFFKISKYHVVVITSDDITRGQTITDRREWLPEEFKKPPNANIAHWVDGPRLLKFFLERIE
ncbi:MAG: nucleoside hydrolase [Candidatus Bathyarchaeia archaeon]